MEGQLSVAEALAERRARAAEMALHASQHVVEMRINNHTVRLGHPDSVNTCNCKDFWHRGDHLAKHPKFEGLPCKHVLFAFKLVNGRDWVEADGVTNTRD